MKAVAFGNRLARYLDVKSVDELTADVRQEILDAINGGLQKMHTVAPEISKQVPGSIHVSAPETISVGVTRGSTAITIADFGSDQYYRTIRISGDGIDNQIVGASEILHPFSGETGTATAIVYCDAVSIPEPYESLVGDPRILETNRDLLNVKFTEHWTKRQVREPRFYQVEANAPNRNPLAPSVIRFDSLPGSEYRLSCEFLIAPARIKFSDLLAPGADIPLREELVELYLLPIAKGILSDSSLWKNAGSIPRVEKQAAEAIVTYAALAPQYLATPRHEVGTPAGF